MKGSRLQKQLGYSKQHHHEWDYASLNLKVPAPWKDSGIGLLEATSESLAFSSGSGFGTNKTLAMFSFP